MGPTMHTKLCNTLTHVQNRLARGDANINTCIEETKQTGTECKRKDLKPRSLSYTMLSHQLSQKLKPLGNGPNYVYQAIHQ